nr:unnamed protein product [Callosobruchus chinensis]
MSELSAESDDSFSDEFDESDLESSCYDSSDDNADDYDSSINDDEDSEPDEPFDVSWVENGIPRPPFPFTDTSGPQVVIDVEDPVGIFELFFDENLIELITEETNRYANQYIIHHQAKLKPKSRVRKWKITCSNEIRTFIGLTILQGICSKPSYEMYFTRRESIETPFFCKIMRESRFRLLHKFLHFADNNLIDDDPEIRKLFKVKPVLDHLQRKFMSVYIPGKNISVDESLIGWKGRLSWKQYIPSKRKRFGIKLFMLCESSTGYIYNFIVYTGASTNYGPKYNDEPVASRIVLSLADSLLNKGHCLFLDNFYSSPDLAQKLAGQRTDCVGTMRINRKGIPVEIKTKKLEKGESIAMFTKKQMIMKWKDKKDVIMISSIHDNKIVEIEKRGKIIKKPEVVLSYNKDMGGVDLSDNFLHFYSLDRTHLKKYYKKIFFHLLNITILNTYILYKQSGGKKTRLNFTIELAEELIKKYAQPLDQQRRRSKAHNVSRFIDRHFPSIIPPTPNKEKPTKRCHICYEKKVRKESRYWCSECRTGLCPAPCFGVYHTKH